MKRVLSIILTVTLVLSFSTFTVFANHGNGQGNNQGNGFEQGFGQFGMSSFKDMKGHWGSEAVEKIQSQGILEGYSDGTFQPDKAITEAELAVILSRLLDKTDTDDEDSITDDEDSDTDDEDLDDVPKWARESVEFGMKHNYFGHGRFHSEVQCNRLYAMVAIAKALDLKPVTDFEDNPFTDWGLISKEDYGYVLALYNEGLITGYPNGKFNPNSMITRAQIAIIIEKYLEGGTVSSDEKIPTWDGGKVTAEAVHAYSVELKWSGAKDNEKVVGYKVIYEVNKKDKVQYASGTTTEIRGLEADKEYEFTVEAKDAAGNWSIDGPSVTVTTEEATEDTELPNWDNDSTVTATAIGADYVDLKWSEADDDDRVVAYKVTCKADNDSESKYFTGRTGRISGLDEGTEYIVTVEAKDAAGNLSKDGPTATFKTLEADAEDTKAPTWSSGSTLTVKLTAANTVTLTWPDAEDNNEVAKYKIYKDSQLVKTVDGDINSYEISGLGANTEYSFKVRAVDDAGNISKSLTATFLNE